MDTTDAAGPAMIRSSRVCTTHSNPVKFLEGSLKSFVRQLGSSTTPASAARSFMASYWNRR